MFDLIGHEEELVKLINNYKSKNLHNSIIINGPKGIGKRFFINKLVEEIIKLNFNDNNYLHHLNLYKNNTHPNIKLLDKEYDQKTKKYKTSITIDQIRNLKRFIYSSPSVQNFIKIIIVDSADDLNINSANSFLKTLEEPSQNTFIFLISHQLSSLLPTLRSRCLKINLKIHQFENFRKILSNEIDNVNNDEIKFLFDLTLGSPGSAILLYNDDLFDLFDTTVNFINKKNINRDMIELSDILSKYDNDKFMSYLSIIKSILIIISKIKNENYNSNYFMSEKFKVLKNISKSIPTKYIMDRFEFLTKNEKDLLTYNLDKKTFMLNFLTS